MEVVYILPQSKHFKTLGTFIYDKFFQEIPQMVRYRINGFHPAFFPFGNRT